MSWLSDLGKTLEQAATTVGDTVTKVVTKDIPRVVTEDIPQIVTKEIPRIVTEDIPVVITKEIPEFFVEDIPEFVGEVVDGPDRDKKDPTLPKRRKDIAALRKRFEDRKEAFFKERALLSETRRNYEVLMETFLDSNIQEAPPAHISERSWEMPGASASTAPEAVENSVRYLLGFVSFSLTEHAWHNKDNRQEHNYLNRQEAALKPVIKQLSKAIAEMNEERADLNAGISEIHERLKAAGLEPNVAGVSELTLIDAEHKARQSLAQRMLGDGTAPQDIAFVTSLSLEEIASLSPQEATLLNDDQAKAVFAATSV